MTENLISSPAYRVAFSMYVAIGGDPNKVFSSVAEIYDAIDEIWGKNNIGIIKVEELLIDAIENGLQQYDNQNITGYKPVTVNVNVPQKYTDEQVESLKDTARQEGYDTGVGVGFADGYSQGETDGYSDGYAEGLDDGAEEQKTLLETISITENGNYVREDGWNEVNVKVSGSIDLDFGQIGYDTALSNECNNYLNNKPKADLAYSKSLYDAWKPSNTSAMSLYSSDNKLVYAPNIDTSNVTYMANMFSSCSQLTTVPLFDTSNVTDMSHMFDGCSQLTTVPLFDTSNVTNMSYMFDSCSQLTTVPLFDTSNVTLMREMFYDCSQLTTVPLFNTSKVTTMYHMFYKCRYLTNIPLFDTSNVTNMYSMFDTCNSLVSLPLFDCGKVTDISYIFGWSDLTKLTDVGGFKNLGAQPSLSLNANYLFNKLPNITYESAMNIINNLYDRKSAGYSVITLKFATKTLALLSDDDIAIATNKGWTIS